MIDRSSPWFAALMVLAAFLGGAAAQDPPDDDDPEVLKDPVREKLKSLNDPGDPTKKKDRIKPDFEFYRGQIAPFDILPYIKEHHWNTLSLEMKANHFDYEGQVQTAAVKLAGMPHAVRFLRDARLQKGQNARISLQTMFPEYARVMNLELARPDAIRPEALWEVNLLKLEPHQMLVAVVGKDAPSYLVWGQKLQAFRHVNEGVDRLEADRNRYYRMVVTQSPDKPLLSPHSMTWTTLSHVIWDGQAPDNLSIAQQQALIDWIHWGGQLVIMGGAGSDLPFLQDSFLGPYLPADASAENATLTQEDLEGLATEFPGPPVERVLNFTEGSFRPGPDGEEMVPDEPTVELVQDRDKIVPVEKKPVFLEGLRPREGSEVIPLGENDPRPIAVERRVGRGRITIVAVRLHDPAFARWKGLDTFVRRVVLRRPEDLTSSSHDAPRAFLSGKQLSWVRYIARDLGSPVPTGNEAAPPNRSFTPRTNEIVVPTDPVAAWLDDAEVPRLARAVLSDASGISIPQHDFVLRVVLAYGIALVPLNYLICRYLLRRREWAWIAVPILALGFAFAVERAAAYDLGFDSACDEVDLLEIQGDYPRAHLSRFAALYSTGRVRFNIAFPNEPDALALPMNAGLGIRGQELEQSSWYSAPVAQLANFQVQPRSLSMFRAEQMIDLGGRIEFEEGEDGRRVRNRTDLELRDATFWDVAGGRRIRVGTIAPGESAPVPPFGKDGDEAEGEPGGWAKLGELYEELGKTIGNQPEDLGALRLVAWTPTQHPGESVGPQVDRIRGVTLVVAHLKYAPPPRPYGPPYELAWANATPTARPNPNPGGPGALPRRATPGR